MAGQGGTTAFGFVGYQRETTKGQFLTPTEFLFVTSHGLNAVADVIQKEVISGTRAANRIVKPAKFKLSGQLAHPLYGNMGIPLFLCALGQETYTTPVNTTATAIVQTDPTGDTGVAVLTVATVAGLLRGAWVTLDTGAAQELRQIVAIDTTALTISVKALNLVHATFPMAVVQPAQHQFTTIPPTSVNPLPMDLPTMSIETNEAGLWSWQWAGCYVAKLDFRAGKDEVEVTEDITGTVLPVRRDAGTTPPMTAFAPTVDEVTDTINPYIITDGYVVVKSDPMASGNSSLTSLPTLESWELSWDNSMIEKAYWDGKLVYKAWPGTQRCNVKYTYSNESKRPAEWEDFVQRACTQFVPFYASMSANCSTNPAVPDWRAFGLAVPNAVITRAEPTRAMGDVIGMNIEAEGVPGSTGDPLCSFFVINSKTTAY